MKDLHLWVDFSSLELKKLQSQVSLTSTQISKHVDIGRISTNKEKCGDNNILAKLISIRPCLIHEVIPPNSAILFGIDIFSQATTISVLIFQILNNFICFLQLFVFSWLYLWD